jgi:cyanophycinase
MPVPLRRIAFLVLLSLFLVSCHSPQEEEPPVDTNVPGTLYVAGDAADIRTTTQPGLALVGGGSRSNEAYAWLIGRSGGGDFVLLTTTDYTDSEDEQFYREMRALGPFDSLATLTVNSRDKADSDLAVQTVRNAELLFIDGGDQRQYYDFWHGTRLEEAIRVLLTDKRIPVGGTSAGMAVLAGWAYLPIHAGATSAEALADPYDARTEEVRGDFLAPALMEGILTDTHWSERNRCGRTVAFLARLIQDGRSDAAQARAVACDEGTAVCIDGEGKARVFGILNRNDFAYFIRGRTAPDRCRAGETLDWRNGVSAYRVRGTPDGANVFDLSAWSGSGGSEFILSASDGVLAPDIQTPD